MAFCMKTPASPSSGQDSTASCGARLRRATAPAAKTARQTHTSVAIEDAAATALPLVAKNSSTSAGEAPGLRHARGPEDDVDRSHQRDETEAGETTQTTRQHDDFLCISR